MSDTTEKSQNFDNGIVEFQHYERLFKKANKFDFVNGFYAGCLKKEEDVMKLRNKLYAQLPTGEVDAFELLKIIKNHIEELDELIY